MKKIMELLFACFFVCLLLSATSLLAVADVRLMSAEELKENLTADNISVLDARSETGWSNSAFKIPGAVRATWDNFDKWSAALPKDKRLVLYCS